MLVGAPSAPKTLGPFYLYTFSFSGFSAKNLEESSSELPRFSAPCFAFVAFYRSNAAISAWLFYGGMRTALNCESIRCTSLRSIAAVSPLGKSDCCGSLFYLAILTTVPVYCCMRRDFGSW